MQLKTFSASWCIPCKTQKPIISAWAENHPEVKTETVSVETPEGAALASKYYIQSVPALVFLNDVGTVLAVQAGVHDQKRLEALYEEARRRVEAFSKVA